MISTFLGYKLYGNNLQQSQQRTAAEPAVSRDQAYYNANIGKVKSVGDLVNNYRLLSYATQAFGLSDMTYAKSLLTKVLESDLSDPKSLANTLNDSRYKAFAAAFGFSTKGTLSTPLQSTSQRATTEALFKANTTLGAAAAATATTAYETAMSSISSISQLEKSPAALGYVLIAYGINASNASTDFEQTLESDLSDPASTLNTQPDSGYLALAQAFNVGADGVTSSKIEAQDPSATTAMTNAYLATIATNSSAQKAAATETTYVTGVIASTTSVSALLGDSRVLAYITKAYGLPVGATKDSITKALSSDTTNTLSFAKTSPFPSYLALAKGFNFDTQGVAAPLPFQSTAQQQTTMQLYMQRATGDTTATAAATAYYKATIGAVHSVADLQKDPKLLAYVETAYGIDPATSNATVASVLQQTKTVDTGSLALAQAFNVNSDGSQASKAEAQLDTATSAATTAYDQAAGSDAASQSAAAVETSYFQSTIAGITDVAGLTGDSRLVAYITKAYGLPSTATAATIQAALTSDTTDSTSFARTSGSAYLALAQGFNFATDGSARSVSQFQSTTQQQTTMQLFTARAAVDAGTAAKATAYYKANIGNVHSVSDLLADPKLLNYALTAYGVDAKTPAATVTAVLQNTNAVDDDYAALTQDFAIEADGLAASTVEAQTADGTSATTAAYMSTIGSDAAAQTAAATETAYFNARIGEVTSVKDLLGDSRLAAYVTKAFGLLSTATTSSMTSALTSDLTDSTSFANLAGHGYLALAEAFSFTTTGALTKVTQLQTSAQQDATVARFAARTTTDSTTTAAAAAYYRANIGAVQSVSDLESDPRLMSYVETAYGLDPTTSATTLASLLEAKQSIVETAPSSALLALKMAFNVDASGNATAPLAAQSSTTIAATTAAYLKNAKTDPASQTAANAATAYYKTAIGSVTSISGLLADPKLVAYIEQAYGLATTTGTTLLRQILTSDVTKATSVARTKGSAAEALAAAFAFTSSGQIASVPQQAQSKAQLDALNTSYIQNKMEDEAGASNPGIKLALYLQINASKITDAYSILADKQLTQVFQTILGLPATALNADIDAQAKTITNQINLADLKDPKKLNALIQRFSILYDLNPPASTAPLTTLSTLNSSTSPLDVTTLFGSPDS